MEQLIAQYYIDTQSYLAHRDILYVEQFNQEGKVFYHVKVEDIETGLGWTNESISLDNLLVYLFNRKG